MTASFTTGDQESGTKSAPLTLQSGNGHSTTEDYYAGWSIVTAYPAGAGTITASSAANPPVLTVTWDIDVTTTTATTYRITTASKPACVDPDATCTIDEIIPAVSDEPDAAGKVSTLYGALTEQVELDCRVDT